MLRKVVGGDKGGKGGKSSEHVKKGKRGDPKWGTKQFADGQYFSQTAYLNVKGIEGNRITVCDSYGGEMVLSRDILEGMYSADHH